MEETNTTQTRKLSILEKIFGFQAANDELVITARLTMDRKSELREYRDNILEFMQESLDTNAPVKFRISKSAIMTVRVDHKGENPKQEAIIDPYAC
ncbi:MAG: hypothetical protein K2H85_10055 [Allobaculum sp.]|nr:hypothetical protein [Allobaculum sp.]